MDSSWDRLTRHLKAIRKNQQWLADRLGPGYSKQRVSNWKTRGVPSAQHDAVEIALGMPAGWLAGRTESDVSEPEPSPMARQIAREFDTIRDPQRALAAFASIIAVVERARSS